MIALVFIFFVSLLSYSSPYLLSNNLFLSGCLCCFKLRVVSRLPTADSCLRNFERRICSFSEATLSRDDLFTAPSQGGERERMCWESMTQWNWHSHYLIIVATSDSLREQTSSQWKPNTGSTPISRQKPFSSHSSLY